MSDEVIKELWQIKEDIAKEHDYDVEALVNHLQSKPRPESQRVVELRAEKRNRSIDRSNDTQ